MVPDAIGTFLSETWLTSDVIEAGIDIPGYSVFHSDRDGRTHGGVAFYHVNRSTRLNNLLDLICSNVPEWFG